jgi:two-component system LytT family response regulator
MTDMKVKFDEFTLDLKGIIVDAKLIPEGVTQYSKKDVVGKSVKILYEQLDQIHKIHKHDLQKAKARKYLTTVGQRVGNNRRLFWARMDFLPLNPENDCATGYKLKVFNIESSLPDTANLLAKYSISKLPIPTRSGYVFVDLKTIIRCEANVNYTIFYLVDGSKIIASKSMRQFEKLLTASNFFRIHKSDMINLEHIRSYSRASGGVVVMDDNSELSISRTFKLGLIAKLNINVFDKQIPKL